MRKRVVVLNKGKIIRDVEGGYTDEDHAITLLEMPSVAFGVTLA